MRQMVDAPVAELNLEVVAPTHAERDWDAELAKISVNLGSAPVEEAQPEPGDPDIYHREF